LKQLDDRTDSRTRFNWRWKSRKIYYIDRISIQLLKDSILLPLEQIYMW
jgi:hypothetical protein